MTFSFEIFKIFELYVFKLGQILSNITTADLAAANEIELYRFL